ncbi:DUF4192 domain-containing protein [Gordonia sp. CPCC 205515]|uniref:DUF4192 domain-containing protein n=1 Tax=Gordonia sp. CPCC 205515 TaxID=3140791 RepID=UPI003AF38BE0
MTTTPRARGARRLTPSALLTAIPGLIGFLPERSLILLAFGDDPQEVRTTMRHDLVLDDDGALVSGMIDLLTQLGDITVRHDARSVVAVIADDRYPTNSLRYRRICEIVDAHFEEAGGILAGFVVPRFAAGAQWRTVWNARRDTPRMNGRRLTEMFGTPLPGTGVLGDPHSSPTALAAAVKHGRRVLHKRSDIAAGLTPLDHCVGAHRDDVDTAGLDEATVLRTIVDHVVGGRTDDDLDCATVTAMGAGLTDLNVRDAALVLAVTDFRHEAEKLWSSLARRLRGAQAASAATMLGHLYYVAGEGAYAGVALDHALDAEPTWNFAILLDTALRNGLPPQTLSGTIPACYEVAEQLGVHLPPPSTAQRAC